MTIKELLEKRAKSVAAARALQDAAETEKRDMTAEETQAFDAHFADVDTDTVEIDKLDRAARLDSAQATLDAPRKGIVTPDDPNPDGDRRDVKPTATPEYRDAFGGFLANGRTTYQMAGEQRALQVDSDTAGGYIVASEQFVNRLIQGVDNQVFIRGRATVIPVTAAQSLGAPSLDADPANPTWTSELAIGSEDSTMAFGKRELKPHPLAQFIKVSNTLLRMALQSPEALVADRLAYKTAVVQENAFLNGSGANEPLGVFTVSDNGLTTGRDVSTGNTTTSIKFDGLIEAQYKLKSAYWGAAAWCFHRDAVKQIRKLKDGNGQYIWAPSVSVGEPSTILNFPYFMSEYAPKDFTSTDYVGVVGDWSHYWIADAMNFAIQRLVELYAATNQVGFISRSSCDGMPVLAEAFVRVQLA